MAKNRMAWMIIGLLVIFSVGATFLLGGNKSGSRVDADRHMGPASGPVVSVESFVGKSAPDFSLETIDGQTIKLSDYRGKKVVLFFSEGAMCYPSCWNQIASLGTDARFNNEKVVSFSIVVDPVSEWRKITSKVPQLSNATILFDVSATVSRAYSALNVQSSMHTGSFPGHTYFIVDEKGVVRFAFDDPRMAVNNDLLASKIKE